MAAIRSKARLRWYHKLLVPVISVSVFLGFSELVCRGMKLAPPKREPFEFVARESGNDVEYPFMVEDADMLWCPKPGFRGQGCYYGKDVQINSAGFRDREYTSAKPADVFRILCLGDSTTFGHALPIDETYHSLLEEMLNLAWQGSGIRYEVINAGVTGYSSAQCLAMYKHRGRKFRPDLVLLYTGPNDAIEHGRLNDDQLLARTRPNVIRRLDESLSNLHCYRTMQRLAPKPNAPTVGTGQMVPRVAPAAFARNIATLDDLCKADACRLVLISFAFCGEKALEKLKELQFDGDVDEFVGWESGYRETLEEAARVQNIPLVRVRPLTSAPKREFFFDSCHPNQSGHALLGLALEQFLTDQGLLAQPSQAARTVPDQSTRKEAVRQVFQAKGLLQEVGGSPAPSSQEAEPLPR